MTLSLEHPWWLIALLPWLGGLAAAGWRSRRRSPRWKVVCLVLPGLAGVLLISALAGPAILYHPRAGAVVLLLDMSPSARQSPWHNPAWVRALAAEHLPPKTRITVVGFDAQPRPLLQDAPLAEPNAWPSQWPAFSAEASNLAAALAWRSPREVAEPSTLAPRWLITDGLLDLAPLAAARQKCAVALTLAPPPRADVGIVDLELRPAPATATADGPHAELWLRLAATGPARGTLRILRDGRLLAEEPFAFSAAGTRSLGLMETLPPAGSVRYDVRLAAGDPWPENDAAAIVAPPAGPPAALLVTLAPAAARPALPGANLQSIAPSEIPTDLAAWASRQIIILDDLPREALAPGAPELLARFVRDTGGGLLILGRRHAFGPGGYPAGDGQLEALSPLASSPPKRPPARIIFLLDASGSMAEAAGPDTPDRKFAMATQGVLNTLRLLHPDDQVLIYGFNASLLPLAQGTTRQIAPELQRTLPAIRPDGSTVPDTALPILERELTDGSLVVLLTDGEIPRMDIPRWRTLLQDAKSRLALIAPAQDRGTLHDLAAATNATYLAAATPRQWATLLELALSEQLLGKAHTTPLPWRAAGAGGGGAAAAGGGEAEGNMEGVAGAWIETWVKPEATLRAQSVDGRHDLAGVWQRGLGRVAAVSFADSSPAYTRLLGDLLNRITPPPGDRRFTAQAQRREDGWLITAQGLDDKGFINGAHLTLDIFPAGGETRRMALQQTAPGGYAALLPGDLPPFWAILTRRENTNPELIARLNPPFLPGREWPAAAPVGAPPEVVQIAPPDPAAAPDTTQWRPRILARQYDPRPGLYLAAVAAMLGALWFRRPNHT